MDVMSGRTLGVISSHFLSHSLSPAQLGVDVLEAVAEDAAHVSHVEEHEGDAEDGVQYRR